LGLVEGLKGGWATGSNETLADLVAERTDGLGVFYVLLYITLWGQYRDISGEAPPSNRQLAFAFKAKPRTIDRYRDRFDAAFPELADPGPLYDLARSKVDTLAARPDVAAFKLGGAVL
jgi:hypothetical protein